jgi:hypothetical protein
MPEAVRLSVYLEASFIGEFHLSPTLCVYLPPVFIFNANHRSLCINS